MQCSMRRGIEPHCPRMTSIGTTKSMTLSVNEASSETAIPNCEKVWRSLGPMDRLFGRLSMKWDKSAKRSCPDVEALDANEREQQLAERLSDFATLAFRRPTDSSALVSFVNLAVQAMEASENSNPNAAFAHGLRAGMRAILCSPRLLYFVEPSDADGQLDHWAIASRLSYFITGSAPDEPSRQAAADSKLTDAPELVAQLQRLLQTSRGQ